MIAISFILASVLFSTSALAQDSTNVPKDFKGREARHFTINLCAEKDEPCLKSVARLQSVMAEFAAKAQNLRVDTHRRTAVLTAAVDKMKPGPERKAARERAWVEIQKNQTDLGNTVNAWTLEMRRELRELLTGFEALRSVPELPMNDILAGLAHDRKEPYFTVANIGGKNEKKWVESESLKIDSKDRAWFFYLEVVHRVPNSNLMYDCPRFDSDLGQHVADENPRMVDGSISMRINSKETTKASISIETGLTETNCAG